MSTWGYVLFVFLTVLLALVFAAGLCQRELRREERQEHGDKSHLPAVT
jgi:hypothetical protein